MRVADTDIPRAGANLAAETRHKRLLQAARTERLAVGGVERTEPRKQLVRGGKAAIETKTDLIDVVPLLFRRGQILKRCVRRGKRNATQNSRRDRVDAVRRNAILGERRAAAGRDRIADGRQRREIATPR